MERHGVPPRDLSDEDLERQGIQAHATRHWVFLHGTEEQFRTHTTRMLELEDEYLRRHPQRTWQGSRNTPVSVGRDERIKDLVSTFTLAVNALLDEPTDAEPRAQEAGDPSGRETAAFLQAFADAEGGTLHKLEAHQLARELVSNSYLVADLYRQDPALLRAERDMRVITPAGRASLARLRREQGVASPG